MNITKHPRRTYFGALLVSLMACTPIKLDPLDLGGDATTGGGGETGSGETGGGQTGVDDTLGATTSPCDQPVSDCSLDLDRDGEIAACDNAPAYPNPGQSDIDGDGFGDVIDLCPILASDANDADEDGDGIGDACDLCKLAASKYNENIITAPAYMRVRNIPDVGDADRDGIGDACDNCVRTPNCQGYGEGPGLTPYVPGMPIDPQADCQNDNDMTPGVGDACANTILPGAAGPVGLGPSDDFDQDGLANVADGCPRQPVVAQACDGPEDCPSAADCTDGACNHPDQDKDGIGDACDTCPSSPNPKQNIDGGAQEDDPDGDFIGATCEGDWQCLNVANPRPFGFYDASVEGICCVKLYDGGGVLDADGNTVEPGPKVLATPGVGMLPPGCAAEAQPVELADVGGDPAALWPFFCLLPAHDQEFDGVPDACDVCPFAYDPGQELESGDGKFCHGAYDPSELDPAMMCLPGT